MSKRRKLQVWTRILKVKLNEKGKLGIGLEIYLTSDLKPDKEYDVVGMIDYRFQDGSGDICYLLIDETGTITPRATSNFEITKMEGGSQ